MTDDYWNNDVSLNDALALLLGHGLWEFRKEKVDLLEHLERNLADCSTEFDTAKASGNNALIKTCENASDLAAEEFERAGVLYTKLCGEIAKLRNNKSSIMDIVSDDADKKAYDLVMVSRQSLFDWADGEKIKVGPTTSPQGRKHTTPLLKLLDELIGEFWEDYVGGPQSTNDTILAYIRGKYGDWTKGECSIPGASTKVFEGMCVIMRHPDLRTHR